MPWETTDEFIRSGHREPAEFQKDTLKTISLNEEDGIKAIVGKPLGKESMEVLSYLFEKSKGWTPEKAKTWFEQHQAPAREHFTMVLPFAVNEKITEKPLRIRGIAMTTGMSRNFNIYTPEELKAFAESILNEHPAIVSLEEGYQALKVAHSVPVTLPTAFAAVTCST